MDKIYAVEKKYGYLSEYIFSDERGRIRAGVISGRARNTSIYIGMSSKPIYSYRHTVSSKMRCSDVATPIVTSLMGHTEKINDDFYFYDVSGDKYKLEIVLKVSKDIKRNMTF